MTRTNNEEIIILKIPLASREENVRKIVCHLEVSKLFSIEKGTVTGSSSIFSDYYQYMSNQTFDHVGLLLPSLVFIYGLLYMKFLVGCSSGSVNAPCPNSTNDDNRQNIVYSKVIN